jgi:tRNA G18 (ribose-2'-O)-methylase SpoU
VYNTAAIFRTAECLGVQKIWLSGYTPAPKDRFGRWRKDFHKVALGTEKTVEWEVVEKAEEFIGQKKRAGFEIVGLEQTDNSQQLKDFIPLQPILLIPGTETTGLDLEFQNLCDTFVEIKQQGNKESLNVHAATAIAIWCLLS